LDFFCQLYASRRVELVFFLVTPFSPQFPTLQTVFISPRGACRASQPSFLQRVVFLLWSRMDVFDFFARPPFQLRSDDHCSRRPNSVESPDLASFSFYEVSGDCRGSRSFSSSATLPSLSERERPCRCDTDYLTSSKFGHENCLDWTLFKGVIFCPFTRLRSLFRASVQ